MCTLEYMCARMHIFKCMHNVYSIVNISKNQLSEISISHVEYQITTCKIFVVW